MKIVGKNTRYYPSQNGGIVEHKVILTVGEIGDFAAYVGAGADDWVMKHGDKISLAEARIHFPSLPADANYRE